MNYIFAIHEMWDTVIRIGWRSLDSWCRGAHCAKGVKRELKLSLVYSLYSNMTCRLLLHTSFFTARTIVACLTAYSVQGEVLPGLFGYQFEHVLDHESIWIKSQLYLVIPSWTLKTPVSSLHCLDLKPSYEVLGSALRIFPCSSNRW